MHTFGDVHIYENHIEQVKRADFKKEPKAFPTVKIMSKTRDIDKMKPEDVILENYEPLPPIRAELTVAGGLYQKRKMNNPKISIICALSENRVIGQGDRIPWHIKADLIHFKERHFITRSSWGGIHLTHCWVTIREVENRCRNGIISSLPETKII